MRFDDIMISFDITISSLIDKKKDFEFSYRNLLTIFQCKRSKNKQAFEACKSIRRINLFLNNLKNSYH